MQFNFDGTSCVYVGEATGGVTSNVTRQEMIEIAELIGVSCTWLCGVCACVRVFVCVVMIVLWGRCSFFFGGWVRDNGACYRVRWWLGS